MYGMMFAVYPMRVSGRLRPRDELANLAPLVGDMRFEEIRDATLMRYVRTARVLVFERPRAACVLAELFEPQIVAMSPQAFTLAGIERVGDRSYAQSWLVRMPDAPRAAVGVGSSFRPVVRIDAPSGVDSR